MFAVIKPPLCGNCSLPDKPSQPIISISEIKNLYHKSSQDKTSLLKLKEKLNSVIDNNDWSFSELSDHTYCHPDIIDCVVYCATGYLCNHLLKTIKCTICKNALINPVKQSFFSAAVLANTKPGLIKHPNLKLYNFIQYLENLFSKYCKHSNVYDLIIADIYAEDIPFPCKEHVDLVLVQIIEFYICMRMRQYVKTINHEKKKINMNVKKSAKYYNT